MSKTLSRRASHRAPRRRSLAFAAIPVVVLIVVFGLGLTTLPVAAADDSPDTRYDAGISAVLHALRGTPPIDEVPAAPRCLDAGSEEIPSQVAGIFRCHLRAAGVSEDHVERLVAEAVTVARCESLWDADAVVFDGRYVDSPHPATGSRYSAAGVFQFIRKTADQWIEGGYAEVADSRRNIDAAARLFIHNRARGYGGWGDWACVAANDGFKATSVLPGWPGGPAALPDWADDY